jgi:hypothetical protein
MWIPTYADLMAETDGHGVNWSYLASEATFERLRAYEVDNRIVPLVGDFAGDRAMRAVARFLREHEMTVSVFYTSNVESYLFGSGAWRRFYTNVATLPLDAHSTYIRTIFTVTGFTLMAPEYRTQTTLGPMQSMVDAVAHGDIRTYNDVLQHSMAPP